MPTSSASVKMISAKRRRKRTLEIDEDEWREYKKDILIDGYEYIDIEDRWLVSSLI